MRTVVRTFHIAEDLDRKMAEIAYRSATKRVTKTDIVNEALRRYLGVEKLSASVAKKESR